MTNEEFIHLNREADIRSLALKKVPEGVDALWCMRQIEGYQLAKKKLPRWAETEGLWYPPRLSMEQCSSEASARYKADIVNRLLCNKGDKGNEGKGNEGNKGNEGYEENGLTEDSGCCKHSNSHSNNHTSKKVYAMADLTGGFGVDFSYMAQGFDEAYYVERQEVLCDAAKHNIPLLGLPHAHIINKDATEIVIDKHFDLIFLDPARRDNAGRKTVAIEDCTPDITAIQDKLLASSTYIMVKLSPMLDITMALKALHSVIEIHAISVKGECKELLFVMSEQCKTPVTTYCVNLETKDETLIVKDSSCVEFSYGEIEKGMWLFEPNASILKAGLENDFGSHYGLLKLHPMSNLFVSVVEKENTECIPARAFHIIDVYDFSKTEQKRLRANIKQANITIRNFPSSVDDVRKRLKIKEGGNDYLFITTLFNNKHVIIHCVK